MTTKKLHRNHRRNLRRQKRKTNQAKTQREHQEQADELEEELRVLSNFYGGNEFKVKLFSFFDKDSEGRSNDTDYNSIPMTLQELKTKTTKPYKLFSRAGHRYIAPANIVQHFASLETAIRRINNGTLEFPDKLFEIEKERDHYNKANKRKYFLNVLTNLVWDTIIESKLPKILPEPIKDEYMKGREFALQNSNVQNLEPGNPLTKVKQLQFLISLYIHQRQFSGTKTDQLPMDVQSELGDLISIINNRKSTLVKTVQDILPSFIELLEKEMKDPDDNSGDGSGGGSGQQGQPPISKGMNSLNKTGSGKHGFGATKMDYFDPTNQLSMKEQAQVEQQVQETLQGMGEDIGKSSGSNQDDKIPESFSEDGMGRGVGRGIHKINKYEDSPYAKRKPTLTNSVYSNILANAMQRTQKHLADKKGKRERVGNSIWNTSDPPRELLLVQSLQTSGILIPNTTTLKAIYDTGKNNESYEYSSNQIIMVDCSGSMGGRPMELSIEAAISAALVAKEDRGSVSVIAFGSQAYEITPPTKDITLVIERLQTLYARGGTSISACMDLATEHLKDMGKANILMITDSMISDFQDKSVMDSFEIMRENMLSYNVFQLDHTNDTKNKRFIDVLNDQFYGAKFWLINYMEKMSFTDQILKTIDL